MAAEIHIGDIGTPLRATVLDQDGNVVDLRLATTKQLLLTKPVSGEVVTYPMAFVTDGQNGQLEYVTATADDLDEAGEWKRQVKVVLPGGTWHTDIQRFNVYPNLD